jgi:TonB family protein
MRVRPFCVSLLELLVLAALPAAAEPSANAAPPPANSSSLEPPALEFDPGVAYPDSALATGFREIVSVDLVLELDATGTVKNAVLEKPGLTAFDEAALGAAKNVRFRPAKRNGTPIAARVRLRYVFEPPPLPPAPAAEPAAEPVPSTPAASEEPIEVTVEGEKRAPATSTFTRAEARLLPGAFGDPLRAIEAMPGVTPIGSGLPYFYVRGAPPGNVGTFLDGIRIPFLYHVAIGPSVVHPGLVDRVDLYPGGYPARLGRFAGGVVSAETAAPRADTHGEANVRLFDAGALAETGFDGGRGTALLAARYSYTAAILSAVLPRIKLDYRDYQARGTYDITESHRVSVFGIGSYDLLAREQPGGLDVLFGAEFYRLNLGHEYRYSAGTLRTDVTLGYDASHFGDEGKAITRSLVARTALRHRLGSAAVLRVGADAGVDEYSSVRPRFADPENPEVVTFEANNPDRTERTFGAWNDVVLEAAPGIEVVPGVRVDIFQSSDATAVGIDPRVAARFTINPRLTLVHTLGVAHQPPAFAIPLPGRSPSDLASGLQKSIQSSAGAEVFLGGGTTFTGTLFQNAYFDMTDTLGTNAEGPPDASAGDRSNGQTRGLELSLQRSLTQRLGGFVAYTLSRSTRTVSGQTFPSAFDRAHVVNAAVGYDLGRAWRAGARLVFYSGAPETEEPDGTLPGPRARNPSRGDPFYRLDVRIEKRWRLGERAWIAFVAEMMNATLSKESFAGTEIGPVTIPSVGGEVGF